MREPDSFSPRRSILRKNVVPLALKCYFLMLLLVSVAQGAAAPSGQRGGEILFLSDRAPALGSLSVYVMNGDGSHERALTRAVPQASALQWLPAGKGVAFESSAAPGDWPLYGGVWFVRRDCSHLRWAIRGLSRLPANPAWSPDGKRMAFVRNDGLLVARADGSRAHRVYRSSNALAAPAWSPDGKRLAVSSGYAGLTVLALGTARVRVAFRVRRPARAPSWSPDGREIAFVGGRGPSPSCLSAGGGSPVWSPDGKLIAFTIGARSGFETARVGVIQPDGGGRRLVGQGYAPTWAPNSSRLAFVDLSRSPDGMLASVNADGTGLAELAEPPTLPEDPSWSLDGSVRATTSCPPQIYDCEIWAVPTSAAPSRQLTKNIVDDRAPVWWP